VDIDIIDRLDHLCFNPLRDDDDLNAAGCDIDCNSTYFTCDSFNESVNNNLINNGLSMFHSNINSMNANFDELKSLFQMSNHKFSIIAVSETYFKCTPPDYFQLPGYQFVYRNRVDKRKGGVGIYASNKIKYKIRSDLNAISTSSFESFYIEVEMEKGKNIIVGVIYKPPENSIDSFNTDFDHILKTISRENKISYLLGDYNIDLLKESSDRQTSDFINIIYSSSFYPTVNKPTRITRTSATIIDNIITNSTANHQSGIFIADISDHLPVFVNTDIKLDGNNHNTSNKTKPEPKRQFTEDNINLLRKRLSTVNWTQVLNCETDDVNTMYNNFTNKFTNLYDECIPIKKINRRKKNQESKSPWITKGLLKSINHKNKLYKSFLKHRTAVKQEIYKTYRNKLNSLIRKAKRSYFTNKLNNYKNNMRSTWKVLKNILNKNKTSNYATRFRDNNNKVYTDPIDITNGFNDFFVNIGPSLAKSINSIPGIDYSTYLSMSKIKHNGSMLLSPITEFEILKLINGLDSNKSPGHDGLGSFLIKKVAQTILKPLEIIFNESISTGIVPGSFKVAKVIPLYKKDDSELFSNYRPVSVLPILSKVLERLVFNRCMSYLDHHNILYKRQYGFRKNHSTYMAVIDLVNKITDAVNNDNFTAGVFLDLSKAFDTIDHSILLDKLYHYGFRGLSYQWFEDYLTNRKQFVYYNGVSSEKKNIICGVPQGSILGPLLFILYVNDIHLVANSIDVISFADDTNLFYSHDQFDVIENVLNNELSNVNQWFQVNKLSVNVQKTNYMLLGTVKNTKSEYHLQLYLDSGINSERKTALEKVSSTKFLGLQIDQNITWKEHIDNIVKTCSRNVGVINKIKNFLPSEALYTLYCSLILPYLNYGILAWGCACSSYINRIFKIQKRALRIISRSDHRSSTHPLLIRYNALSVKDMYTLELATFMYKHENCILPSVFDDLFTKHSDIHGLNTRNKDHLRLPFVRKVFCEKSIKYAAIKVWNSVDNNIKSSSSVNQFRSVYKKQLMQCYT
jgi:hypothetical protein